MIYPFSFLTALHHKLRNYKTILQNREEQTEKILKTSYKKTYKGVRIFFDLNWILLASSLVNGVVCVPMKIPLFFHFMHTTSRPPG